MYVLTMAKLYAGSHQWEQPGQLQFLAILQNA